MGLAQLLAVCLRHHLSERGASLVEYALLVALLALVCFAAVDVLGGATSQAYDDFGQSMQVAGN